MKPLSLTFARIACRRLPPIVGQRLRSWLYPRRLARAHDYLFIAHSITGSRIYCRTSDYHGGPFAVHGFYEWRNLAVALAVCRPGDTVVEVGANVGTETIGFADIVGPLGKVHAFEPLPANVEILERSLALDPASPIVLHASAAGNRNETLHFLQPPDWRSGTGRVVSGQVAGHVIEVPCVTLDAMAGQIGPIRGIFVDAEGSELAILDGARATIAEHRPVIVLEASPHLLKHAGATLGDVITLLDKADYLVRRIGRLSLHAVSAEDGDAANWVAAPVESALLLYAQVERSLRRCAVMPCVLGLNPLERGGR